MHIKPSRVETDEVVIRLRRIEERLGDLIASQAGKPQFESSLQYKMKGLPAAEEEAGRLLQRMSPEEAIETLERQGLGRVMAESAVAMARVSAKAK